VKPGVFRSIKTPIRFSLTYPGESSINKVPRTVGSLAKLEEQLTFNPASIFPEEQ
jgi:hypothetical protein